MRRREETGDCCVAVEGGALCISTTTQESESKLSTTASDPERPSGHMRRRVETDLVRVAPVAKRMRNGDTHMHTTHPASRISSKPWRGCRAPRPPPAARRRRPSSESLAPEPRSAPTAAPARPPSIAPARSRTTSESPSPHPQGKGDAAHDIRTPPARATATAPRSAEAAVAAKTASYCQSCRSRRRG